MQGRKTRMAWRQRQHFMWQLALDSVKPPVLSVLHPGFFFTLRELPSFARQIANVPVTWTNVMATLCPIDMKFYLCRPSASLWSNSGHRVAHNKVTITLVDVMGTFCNWRARLGMFKILQCRMPKTKRALPTLSKHRSGANLSRETSLALTRRLIVVNSMQHWVFF